MTPCSGRTLPKRINATLAEYLWEATPFARYIVMFRDPVSRYRSAYFYYRCVRLGERRGKQGPRGSRDGARCLVQMRVVHSSVVNAGLRGPRRERPQTAGRLGTHAPCTHRCLGTRI